MYVCHAEMNAILNKNAANVEGRLLYLILLFSWSILTDYKTKPVTSCYVLGCTMYVALFPCNECTKMILQAGIKEVVYFR